MMGGRFGRGLWLSKNSQKNSIRHNPKVLGKKQSPCFYSEVMPGQAKKRRRVPPSAQGWGQKTVTPNQGKSPYLKNLPKATAAQAPSEDIRKRPPAGRLPLVGLGDFHLAQPFHYLKGLLNQQQLFPPQHFHPWLSTKSAAAFSLRTFPKEI